MSCYGYCEKEEIVWEVFWDGDYILLMREVTFENGELKKEWHSGWPHDKESDKIAQDMVESFKKWWLKDHPPVTSYPMKCKGDCICEYDDTEEVRERYSYPVDERYLVAGSNSLSGYVKAKVKLRRTLRISYGSCGDNPVGQA